MPQKWVYYWRFFHIAGWDKDTVDRQPGVYLDWMLRIEDEFHAFRAEQEKR